jgi:hypothetical protein
MLRYAPPEVVASELGELIPPEAPGRAFRPGELKQK